MSKSPPRFSNEVQKHSHYSQRAGVGVGEAKRINGGKKRKSPASYNKNRKKLQISTGLWTCHSLEHRVLGEGLGDLFLSRHRLLPLQAARSHCSLLQTTHLKPKQRWQWAQLKRGVTTWLSGGPAASVNTD